MMKNVQKKNMSNYPRKKERKTHAFIPLYISELPHFNGKKTWYCYICLIDNQQGNTYHPLSAFDC